jgi:hypothetical protein
MTIPINTQDIIFAAGLAFVLTGLINVLTKIFKSVINKSTEFDYAPRNRDSVLERCRDLFPTEYLRFNDALFRRGMEVRVSTYRNKLVEGQFIGVNNDNMICIVTQHRVVAQELNMIEDIEEIE